MFVRKAVHLSLKADYFDKTNEKDLQAKNLQAKNKNSKAN